MTQTRENEWNSADWLKKVSNMYYGLAVSPKLEKHLLVLGAAAAAHGADYVEGEESLEGRTMNMED